MRFPGWEQITRDDAGRMIGGEWSLVLHTTEGSTIVGAMSALDRQNSWPQFMADPRTHTMIQAMNSDLAGKALSNKAGGVETNRENTIQIEIVGFASESQDWPDEHYDWLGKILAPVMDHHGIGRYGPTFYGQDAGFTLASANAPQRMSFPEWDAFGGVCGHQHVPENDHWDPGKFQLHRFLAATGGKAPAPEKKKRRNPHMIFVIANGDKEAYQYIGGPTTEKTSYIRLYGSEPLVNHDHGSPLIRLTRDEFAAFVSGQPLDGLGSRDWTF